MTFNFSFSTLKLKKLKKKDKVLFDRLKKKLKELRKNPKHYKLLRNVLKGNRAAHLNPFVVVFNIQDNIITVHYVKHHDKAY